MLTAVGVNSYIYIHLLLGFGKFKIQSWEYELIICAVLILLLKLQPRVMSVSINGYGSILWLISNCICCACFFLLKFLPSTSKHWGFFGILLLPASVLCIDINSRFTLAWYANQKPVYYSNTTYIVWNNMSIAICALTLACLYGKKDVSVGHYDQSMLFLAIMSAIAAFISLILLLLSFKNNRFISNYRA